MPTELRSTLGLFRLPGISVRLPFFFSSRRRHTRCLSDWSSDVCSSDLSRVHRPYSYLHPVSLFPQMVEVCDRAGERLYQLADLPLADRIPVQGVRTGPRAYQWRPDEPASLVWVEAIDGGNPKEKVPHRDRMLTLA